MTKVALITGSTGQDVAIREWVETVIKIVQIYQIAAIEDWQA